MFINDLTIYLKSLAIGIHIDGDQICILLNVGNMVIASETASELQLLLNVLNAWCKINDMNVNENKSNTVHFRSNSIPVSDVIFACGNNIVDKYTYLGIVLHEHIIILQCKY